MKRTFIYTLALLLFAGTLFAQEAELQTPPEEPVLTPMDTLINAVRTQGADLSILKKIKFSGLIQTQFQYADSVGAKSFAGGDFNKYTDKRFSLRRARLKAEYEGSLSKFVFQFDAADFSIKDIYVTVKDPWFKIASLTLGNQDRPFGFEIGYSSSAFESPERGRMSQIIFNGERDFGAKLTLQAPKDHFLHFLKLDIGLFNGTGDNKNGQAIFDDIDKYKDLITHLSFSKTIAEKFKVSGGVSYYLGGNQVGGTNVAVNKVYVDGSLAGIKGFTQDLSYNNASAEIKKEYLGADLQFTFDSPFGLTTIRGEYIQGQQPADLATTGAKALAPIGAAPATGAVIADGHSWVIRNFNGGYFYFIQNILHSKSDIIVKYDFFNPNTKISSSDVGLGAAAGTFVTTSSADISYSTIGLGYIYHWDKNVKFTLYYDMVSNGKTTNNAKTSVLGMSKDLTDNTLTARIQFSF